MSYSDYLVQWRNRHQGTDLHVLDVGRSGFLDSGPSASPGVTVPQPWRREVWPDRSLTDLRPAFGDKARDFAELVVVAVFMAAVFAEMAILFGGAALH
jgi:hypothetical protein